ncbi:cold shock CspA family protein [Sphingomonas sp. F9_3S_D5_B_2]
MKYSGTVKKFDSATGLGEINPQVAGNSLRFETSAIAWDRKIQPIVGQRLSYDVGHRVDSQPWALNLQTA